MTIPTPYLPRARSQPPGPLTPPNAMPKGPGGNPLCRWCGTETAGKRRTFCSKACVQEWEQRSNPAVMRAYVIKRDGRVCALCQDRDALHYEVDHIQPISEGGTNEPSNLRVLCRRCHGKETGKLRKRLNASERARATEWRLKAWERAARPPA